MKGRQKQSMLKLPNPYANIKEKRQLGGFLMKKVLRSVCAALLAGTAVLSCSAASASQEEADSIALPDLNDGNWYETMHTDFTRIKNMAQLHEAGWAPSPHGLRNYEYWCDQMISFTNEGLVIRSERQSDHQCEICGVSEGVFTGGIETRETNQGKSSMLFAQAFGYFEATVIVPRGSGMWSAFWLQSDACGQIGNRGEDGSEIDVYESSFMRQNPTKTGQAIHYDAYDAPFYRSKGNVTDVGKNLYDGEAHTYALKWTPNRYIMYVDGEVVWSTNYGGVSKTPEYLRLTTEIRNNGWGPYGQKIGQFKNHADGTNDFVIKEVRVYQNREYEPYIKSPADYQDMKKRYLGAIIGSSVAGGLVVASALGLAVRAAVKKGKVKKRGK